MKLFEKNALILFGPTASGKTTLAIEIAKLIGGEIVSVDSQQVYRELFIGTARPSTDEMEDIPHHLIGHVSVKDRYNVSKFLADAQSVIGDILSRGKRPLVTGGSYMWIACMIDGFSPTPPSNPKIRAELENRVSNEGLDSLYKELMNIDPESAERISSADKRRIIRALEIIKLTCKQRSEVFKVKTRLPYNFTKIAIKRPRQELYHRINRRVDAMVENGLLEEIQWIIDEGLEEYVREVRAHGYPPLLDYFHGVHSLDFALERMKTETRRYAKRQLSFLSGRDDFTVLDTSSADDILHWID